MENMEDKYNSVVAVEDLMEMPSLDITYQGRCNSAAVKTEVKYESHTLLANVENLDLLCVR